VNTWYYGLRLTNTSSTPFVIAAASYGLTVAGTGAAPVVTAISVAQITAVFGTATIPAGGFIEGQLCTALNGASGTVSYTFSAADGRGPFTTSTLSLLPAGAVSGGTSVQACRTYPVSILSNTDVSGATPNAWSSGRSFVPFNTSTNQLVDSENYQIAVGPGQACQVQIDTTATYGSTADFIEEVTVIPPLTRATRVASLVTTKVTFPPGASPSERCGPVSSTLTYSYDGQGRLVRAVDSRSTGGTAIATYTAWDSAGRPTAGTEATASGNTTISIANDDATRTRTITRSDSLGTSMTVQTFDERGILINSVSTSGSDTTRYRASVQNALQVCR